MISTDRHFYPVLTKVTALPASLTGQGRFGGLERWPDPHEPILKTRLGIKGAAGPRAIRRLHVIAPDRRPKARQAQWQSPQGLLP